MKLDDGTEALHFLKKRNGVIQEFQRVLEDIVRVCVCHPCDDVWIVLFNVLVSLTNADLYRLSLETYSKRSIAS